MVLVVLEMKSDELEKQALEGGEPPQGISLEGRALWHARVGDWDMAHDLCQKIPGKAGSWIHAWLHREEGDIGNAGYWYSRAGKEMPGKGVGLEEEWRVIAKELLG